MNKNYCAFTIVAKNYIGLAKVLQSSLQDHTPDVDFYIFVADDYSSIPDVNMPNNVYECRKVLEYTDEEWLNMAFKYNLTEFCTAIKPYCFQHLLYKLGYEEALYFDPDIFVFSSLAPIYETLQNCSIIVTPHILFPSIHDDSDRAFLQSGPYNLGFLGIRKTEYSKMLLNWWGVKLKKYCFDEVLEYTFTDQKWMLMIHSFIPQNDIVVSRNLGLNVAPWNFIERKIIKIDNRFRVECRDNKEVNNELVFVHYSGYDYRALLDGKEIRPRVSKVNVDFEDVNVIMSVYVEALRKHEEIMREYLSFPYSFATFENGIKIEKFHRRLYHRIAEIDGNRYVNPFIVGNGSFYENLKSKGLINANSQETITDKVSGKVSKTLIYFNMVMRLVSKLIGYQRYLMLLRLLKHFSRYESQIFLLDKKYRDCNISIPDKKVL